jgi:hypothetical protein
VKHVGVSKKFCLLDVAGSSHSPPPPAKGIAATHGARVLAFDNLGDGSSPDVCQTPLSVRTIERRVYPPPSVFGEFLGFRLAFITAGPDNCFIGAAQPLPSLDFLLKDLDETLETYLHCVSFVLPSYFHAFVLAWIDCLISQALALSEKQRVERAIESMQIAKNKELEVLVRSQAEKH